MHRIIQLKRLARRLRRVQYLRRSKTAQRGQGLVEFALVLPVLILLFLGILEFGYFFFAYSTVNSATREAVRYGAASGTSDNGLPYYEDCAGIQEVATRIGRYANVQVGDVDIFYDNGPGTSSLGDCGSYTPKLGERVVVNISVKYYPIMLFGGRKSANELTTIQAQSARTIIYRLQIGG